MNKKNRIGEISYNNIGLKMQIIEYKNSQYIKVGFENGYQTISNYSIFKKGEIKNLLYTNYYNIGYIGEGNFKTYKDGKCTKCFNHWRNMLQRCYDVNFHKKQPTYQDCIVCEQWHNFQNFAKWYDKNYYMISDEIMCLDKDILIKGNKIYSPETCIFVTKVINILFTKRNKCRGDYFIGVKKCNKNSFSAICNNGKEQIYIGTFKTELKAFNAYKEFKENIIKQVAYNYKDKIPEKLYNAMYNYQVEIDD